MPWPGIRGLLSWWAWCRWHLLVDFQRLGALGCIVGDGGGFGNQGDGTELLNGVEIVHGAHEAGECHLQVTLSFRLEGHLVCLGDGDVAGADTVVDDVPHIVGVRDAGRSTGIEPEILGVGRVDIGAIGPEVGIALGEHHIEFCSIEVALHAKNGLVDQCLIGLDRCGEVVHGESAGVLLFQ